VKSRTSRDMTPRFQWPRHSVGSMEPHPGRIDGAVRWRRMPPVQRRPRLSWI